MSQETTISKIDGVLAVFIQICLLALAVFLFVIKIDELDKVSSWVFPVILMVSFLAWFGGYIILEPNEAANFSFMGKFKGSLRENGFFWVNPFFGANHWSLKVSNHQTKIIKVNVKGGVPVEIAAIISWKHNDIYKAEYDVEHCEAFIENQFDISLRNLAKNHSYDELSSGEEKEFITDLTDKVSVSGAEIMSASISHLNYATEIASSMLQKQQAKAVGEAKEIIVDTAVSIAQSASSKVDGLTKEQKAKFASDLILVLCSDKGVSPVITL